MYNFFTLLMKIIKLQLSKGPQKNFKNSNKLCLKSIFQVYQKYNIPIFQVYYFSYFYIPHLTHIILRITLFHQKNHVLSFISIIYSLSTFAQFQQVINFFFFYFRPNDLIPYIQILLLQIKMNSPSKVKKNQYIPISVLDLPPKNHLMQINTNNSQSQYILYKLSDKKLSIEGYKIFLENSKVFSNIEIYKWRRLTQFPISKTHFVNVKPNNLQHSNIVELMVYNQHCPLKFDSMTQLSLPQILYILKEALLGFERLFNRFGPFHISPQMIRFNQKGYCKVWINQNFGLNTFLKIQKNQSGMLNSVVEIIQHHYEQQKGKKLFLRIKQCKTFLGALKQLENYIASFKIIVPNRHVDNQTQRPGSPENQKLYKLNRNKKESIYSQNVRNSTIQNNIQDISGTSKLRQPVSLQKPLQQRTQQHIKKIKSYESLALNTPHRLTHNNVYNIPIPSEASQKKNKFISNPMKDSHTYSRNKYLKINENFNSQRQYNVNRMKLNNNEENLCQSDGHIGGKFNESKVILIREQYKAKQKKDLSCSQVPVNPQEKRNKMINQNRSSSTQKNEISTLMFSNSLDHSFTIGNKSIQLQLQNLKKTKVSDQFANVLNDNGRQSQIKSLRQRIRESQLEQSDEQQKMVRASHTNSVMRNNGWKFNQILEVPKELNQSFHEGQDQNVFVKSIELKKLNSLGKRAVAMSLLPQECE